MKPVWNRSETRYDTETCRTTKKLYCTLCTLEAWESSRIFREHLDARTSKAHLKHDTSTTKPIQSANIQSTSKTNETTKLDTHHTCTARSVCSHIIVHYVIRQPTDAQTSHFQLVHGWSSPNLTLWCTNSLNKISLVWFEGSSTIF